MPPEYVSPLAKAATGVVVAVVQLGLLAMLAVGSVHPPTPDQGGAPVIELTLSPRAAFDSVDGSTEAVASKGGDHPKAAHEPEVQTAPVRPAPRPSQTLFPTLQTTPIALTSAVSEPLVSFQAEGGSEAEPGPDGAQDLRRGLTGGGGAATSGANGGAQVDDYYAQVLHWVETHKRHPGGVTGLVTVAFTLDRRGRVSDARILSSSGRAALDAATLSQIRAAEPFPRPPAGTTWRTREFRVRLDYRPREGGRDAR